MVVIQQALLENQETGVLVHRLTPLPSLSMEICDTSQVLGLFKTNTSASKHSFFFFSILNNISFPIPTTHNHTHIHTCIHLNLHIHTQMYRDTHAHTHMLKIRWLAEIGFHLHVKVLFVTKQKQQTKTREKQNTQTNRRK